MKNPERLIGRKVRGFKFETTKYCSYVKGMDKYVGKIGKIGIIDEYRPVSKNFKVEFEDGEYWGYPADQIEAHLVVDEIPTFTKEDLRTANFLNQPLTLGMFVPCDEEGNVLEEYIKTTHENHLDKYSICRHISKTEIKYQQAKDKVLFEGFEICNRTSNIDCVVCKDDHISLKLLKGKTVEDLIYLNLKLTPNAIKQLKL